MDISNLKSSAEEILSSIDHKYQDLTTRKYTTVILDTEENLEQYDPKIPINLIISPSLYWIKETELIWKSTKEASKYSQSLFDYLIADQNYDFFVFQASDKFIYIAYEKEKIATHLKLLNLQNSQIKNIFFAQSEFQNATKPIKISGTKSFLVDDEVVYCVPNDLCDESDNLDTFLQDHYFSKNSFSIEAFEEDFIDNKMMITTWILLFVSISILVFNIFLNTKQTKHLLQEREVILKNYSIDESFSKVTAIKNSLQKIEQKQTSLREKISYAISADMQANTQPESIASNSQTTFIAPGTNDVIETLSSELEDKEYLKELDFKNNELVLSMVMNDDKRAEYIKDYLAKKFKIDSIEAKNKVVTARLKL